MSTNSAEAISSKDASTLHIDNTRDGGIEGSKIIAKEDEADGKRPPKRPRSSNDQSETTTSSSTGNDTGSNNSEPMITNQIITQQFKELDWRKLQDIACGSCIFCRMPRCGRCFICVSNNNAQGQPGEGRGYCLRKICIAIPIEFKLQHAVKLGFPPGWRYAFDDPQKMSLVIGTKRILALAGLKIVSPEGKLYHSLESAFAHIPHSPHNPLMAATTMVEKFLVHVGSSRHVSVPHFLVDKNYCIEFTGSSQRGGSNNIVLFGKIIACMGPSAGKSEEDKSFFIVQYDRDVLSIAKSMGTEVQPIQLISSELAWGGCISYERKTCCRRDSHSAIQNIDQATAAETWIAPDMRLEDMVERPDGTSLPQLTIVARGYKFVFRVKISNYGDKQHFGVFASCTSMQESANQEINLKPGELIDLGIFAPIGEEVRREEDRKTLPAFIIKNYIHKFKISRWGVVSGRDNVIYDLTDDKTGKLHDSASKRVLSYIRKRTKGEFPTINARIAPDMRVHLLFGIQYEGNWREYEAGMQELVPLFSGREVEVTISRHYGFGSKHAAGSKYLQSISMFQTEDIVACNSQLDCMFDSSETVNRFPPNLIDRSKKVVKCLEERTQQLLKMFSDAKSQEDGSCIGDSVDDSPLISVVENLKKLARMLERHHSEQ